MTLPDRPVDGAEIATDWGQEIHDRTFAPSGCAVRGNATQSCGTTPAQLQMDTVIDDPGGFLDAPNDQVVIPTDREGLYSIIVNGDAVNGTAATTQTRLYLLINGTSVATGLEDNNGATHITVTIPYAAVLSAGDILTVNGQRRGSGSNPDVKASIIMFRLGAELWGMTQPTYKGRLLPPNDWEGDDFTPGAGGKYVTCMDTATGRMVYYATNGRVDHDGRYYRAHVYPPDPNGVNFAQMDDAVKLVNTKLDIRYHSNWTIPQVQAHLKRGQGLIVTGMYDRIPAKYRHQESATFSHAMFISHMNRELTAMRLWDPLDPDLGRYGRHVPTAILWPFLRSLGNLAGYVPLHPLSL